MIFGQKMATWTRGNVGNSRSMEHLAGIFGFIVGLHMWCEEGFSHWIQSCRNLLHGSAMVVFWCFPDWNLLFARKPPPPRFCLVNHVQLEGCLFPPAGQFWFGRCHASRILWGVRDPLPRVFSWRLGEPYKPIAWWWFQLFFIFTPTLGRFPIWLIFFSWVETTN